MTVTALTRARAHFPLDRATVCLDCDECFEILGTCPACGSQQVASLGRFLDDRPRLAWMQSVGDPL